MEKVIHFLMSLTVSAAMASLVLGFYLLFEERGDKAVMGLIVGLTLTTIFTVISLSLYEKAKKFITHE